MKIGIDLRMLARGTRTGVEEYALNITRYLIEQNPDVEFRLFYNAFRKVPLEFPWVKNKNVSVVETRLPNRLIERTGQIFGLPKLDRLLGGVDIFFSPHFFWASIEKAKHVITIHDLSFVRFPEFFSLRRLYWHRSIQPARQVTKATHVIADSQSTKNDTCNLWHVRDDKITVVPLGIDHHLFSRPTSQEIAQFRVKYSLPEHFVLFLGTIEPRKNIIGALRAFSMLQKEHGVADWHFVICGNLGWRWQPVFEEVKNLKLESSVHHLSCGPEERPLLYSAATCLLFPSYFEGFGLPPLEAMAVGLPVITSNRSSLPEAAGDAALMIDPWREAELKDALVELIKDTDLQNTLKTRGLARAQQFSWAKTAEQTFQVFQKLL